MRGDGQGGPSLVEGSAPTWRWEELGSHADKTQLSGIKEGSSIQETVYRKSSHLATCLLTQPHLAFDLIHLQTCDGVRAAGFSIRKPRTDLPKDRGHLEHPDNQPASDTRIREG